MLERLKKRTCQSGFLVNLPIFIVGVDRVICWPLLLPKATCERGGKRGLQILFGDLLTEWCSLCGNDRCYWPALKRSPNKKIQPKVEATSAKLQAASNA